MSNKSVDNNVKIKKTNSKTPKKTNKKTIKIIILIVAIIIGILIGNLSYKNYTKNKMKKILEENNYSNYELVENYDDEETTVKVRNNTLLSESDSSITWISEEDKKRIIIEKNSKIALIAEQAENLEVNNLNYTYINNYFEDSNQKFKYLGKKNEYYKFEFTNKNTGLITTFYLNTTNNIIEKKVETLDNAENIVTYTVKPDCVSKNDIESPDLTDYKTTYSSSSGAIQTEENPATKDTSSEEESTSAENTAPENENTSTEDTASENENTSTENAAQKNGNISSENK